MYVLILMLLLSLVEPSQQIPIQNTPKPNTATAIQQLPAEANPVLEEHKLTVDEIIDINVFEVPELSGTFRVSTSGYLTLPLIGNVQAAGLDANIVARSIEEALREKYIKDPHVTIGIKEYSIAAVSVIGAVKMAGIQPIRKSKPLLDVIAGAGGLSESAGSVLQVIRSGSTNVITISVEDLFQNGKVALNIPLYAGDVVNVLPAMSIFIVGEVVKPGEYPLKFNQAMTVRQAIAIGGGFTKQPKKKDSKIIRYHPDGKKEEIPLNLERIMEASHDDMSLMPNDILFVPSSKAKNAASRTLDVAIAVASARLVYVGR